MSQKRILILDDEPHIRQVVSLKLKAAGYEVVERASADDGLEAAEELSPDLVVSDYNMPGSRNGIDLVKALREKEATADTPIIMLTGSVAITRKLEIEIGDVGRFALISKPFSPRGLLKMVQAMLSAAGDDEDPGGSQ